MIARVVGVLSVAAVVSGLAGEAQAQSRAWRNVGLGVDVGFVEPLDGDVDGSAAWGFTGGFAPRDGFGVVFGFGWFDAELIDESGQGEQAVGALKIRPLMIGAGYTWVRGLLAMSASVTAGISFNSGEIYNSYTDDIGGPVDLDVSNSVAIRPAFGVEYFLTPKFAVTGSVSYLFTNPDIVLTSATERFSDTWDASTFNLFAGIMVYPFRR